jgi:hypothetical protein
VVDVTTYGFRKIVTLAKNLVICVAQKKLQHPADCSAISWFMFHIPWLPVDP